MSTKGGVANRRGIPTLYTTANITTFTGMRNLLPKLSTVRCPRSVYY